MKFNFETEIKSKNVAEMIKRFETLEFIALLDDGSDFDLLVALCSEIKKSGNMRNRTKKEIEQRKNFYKG